MNETERKVYLEQFNRRTHVLGRAVCVITLVLLVGAPFLIGTFLGAMPDMGAVGKGFLSVGIVWAVSSVAEFLIYTPMLGAGGGYLAFITGNLINMKIPCAVNARDIVGTKTGTITFHIHGQNLDSLQSTVKVYAADGSVVSLGQPVRTGNGTDDIYSVTATAAAVGSTSVILQITAADGTTHSAACTVTVKESKTILDLIPGVNG